MAESPFDDGDDPLPDVPGDPPLAVYCPGCGAYLLTLGLEPDECELCGFKFPSPSGAKANAR